MKEHIGIIMRACVVRIVRMCAVYGCRFFTFIVLCAVIISRFELVEIIMHSLNILSSLLMIGLLCLRVRILMMIVGGDF